VCVCVTATSFVAAVFVAAEKQTDRQTDAKRVQTAIVAQQQHLNILLLSTYTCIYIDVYIYTDV